MQGCLFNSFNLVLVVLLIEVKVMILLKWGTIIMAIIVASTIVVSYKFELEKSPFLLIVIFLQGALFFTYVYKKKKDIDE